VATVKLPVNVPPEIEHVGVEENRPEGADERVHVVPAKLDPETVTLVPPGPDVGLKENVEAGPDVTVNEALAESVDPKFDVAVTV
jgi:hypothetical protein